MPTYTPSPLDTGDIKLPQALTALLERLAEDIHNVWDRQRIEDGWTYGSTRDDAKKKHPCLVPYPALPESEKVYDRTTAGETLKMIIKLGYTLVPPC
jgi:hypothetical protein